jgi:predicted DsbA family dithiol-disulfide isomerase
MKVEIWSDIMCPFCYIGKRRFEKAIESSGITVIEITWKSFQLNPAMKTDPSMNINEYLAGIKGWSLEQAKSLNSQVTQMAKEEGLIYDFDKAVVANSFDAHRLIQYAKTLGKGDHAEERLFKAYFTEGKNIADTDTLADLGNEIGLLRENIESIFKGNDFSDEVFDDIREAEHLGIRGVPFFVIDRKYAVSGAQPVEVFVEALTKK